VVQRTRPQPARFRISLLQHVSMRRRKVGRDWLDRAAVLCPVTREGGSAGIGSHAQMDKANWAELKERLSQFSKRGRG
jgi:hypothetical protein